MSPPTRAARVVDLLTSPKLPLWLAGLTILVTLPALTIGWIVDDWVHQALIRERLPELMGAWPLMDMFRFMDGDPIHNAELRDLGILSWWAPDTLRASFWRPLTVATHLLDDQLMRGAAWFAHAHSIAWGGVLVLAATVVYRRLHGTIVVAGLAALLYAVDDARSLPVGWVANRSALLATLAGLGALGVHDRWRRDGWRPGAVLGPILLAVGLFSAESALAVTAYLFAHALFLDRGPLLRRLAALAPYALVVVLWRLLYNSLGYGAAGSGLYLDPVREPLLFAAAAVERLPVLLASQWTNIPSIVYTFLAGPLAALWLLGAFVVVALVAWLVRDLLRTSATARFHALGMVLATVPVCATFPSNRLLIFVGFGGAGLLAELLHRLWQRSVGDDSTRARARRGLAVALFGLHGVLAPISLAGGILSLPAMIDPLFHACADAMPDDEGLGSRTVILVNSNDLCASDLHFIRAVQGRSRPARVRLLASAMYDIEVRGIDEHTIEVRPHAGWHGNPADCLLRGADNPLPIGHRMHLTGVAIEVMSHNAAGLVDAVRFRFEVPLRAPSLLWLANRDFELTPFEPPAPGQSAHLARAF